MVVSKAFFNKALDADWDLIMRTEGFNGTPREVLTVKDMINCSRITEGRRTITPRKSGKTFTNHVNLLWLLDLDRRLNHEERTHSRYDDLVQSTGRREQKE